MHEIKFGIRHLEFRDWTVVMLSKFWIRRDNLDCCSFMGHSVSQNKKVFQGISFHPLSIFKYIKQTISFSLPFPPIEGEQGKSDVWLIHLIFLSLLSLYISFHSAFVDFILFIYISQEVRCLSSVFSSTEETFHVDLLQIFESLKK